LHIFDGSNPSDNIIEELKLTVGLDRVVIDEYGSGMVSLSLPQLAEKVNVDVEMFDTSENVLRLPVGGVQ
jgi:hypothetical protein